MIDVGPGAPSAEAYAFFSVLVVQGTTLIGLALKGWRDARLARDAAEKAKENTENVSNGFTGRVDRNFEELKRAVGDIDKRIDAHMEWHAHNPPQER